MINTVSLTYCFDSIPGASPKYTFYIINNWESFHNLRVLESVLRTYDALHFSHQAAGWRRRGLLREVTGVEDVVHRGAVLAVVEQLVVLGILKKKQTICTVLSRNGELWSSIPMHIYNVTVQQFTYLVIENTSVLPRYVVAMPVVGKAHIHVSTLKRHQGGYQIHSASLSISY